MVDLQRHFLDEFHTMRAEPGRGRRGLRLLKDSFTTLAGRLMFQVIGAMAQFERDLIRERIRSGMANAKRKGIGLGRRHVGVDVAVVPRIGAEGLSFEASSRRMGLSVGSVFRAVQIRAAA